MKAMLCLFTSPYTLAVSSVLSKVGAPKAMTLIISVIERECISCFEERGEQRDERQRRGSKRLSKWKYEGGPGKSFDPWAS